MLFKNKLKRKNLIDTLDCFSKQYNVETDENKKELINKLLVELEYTLNKYVCKYDDKFIIDGRREFLREEFTLRLNKENIKLNKDYLIDAYYDLKDYITNEPYNTSLFSILKAKSSTDSATDIIKKNNDYRKRGVICKQEKEILLDMIDEFKNTIKREAL